MVAKSAPMIFEKRLVVDFNNMAPLAEYLRSHHGTKEEGTRQRRSTISAPWSISFCVRRSDWCFSSWCCFPQDREERRLRLAFAIE